MQLMAFKNVYGEEGDCLNTSFMKLISSPPNGFTVLEGNAGLGADWPAAIWKSGQALALALAVFAAPATIKENWPLWKEMYDEAVTLMLDFHGEFHIDRDSAQMIAVHHAIEILGMDATNLNIHMAIRHYRQSSGSYQDLLLEDRIDMNWSDSPDDCSPETSHAARSNEEAAKQASCRYIFGVDDLNGCKTIVIEHDGSVSLSLDLK